jgi:hypothetical protein
MSKLKPGDTLYLPAGGRNSEATLTVKKVGRKWITTDESWERFDVTSLRGEQYGTQLYVSKEAYDEQLKLSIAWSVIRKFVDRAYRKPPHVTLDVLNQVAELLGVELPEKP